MSGAAGMQFLPHSDSGMNPRDFLDVADEWAANNREAEWRSAVSRAYYAAFHVACTLLRRCGFAVPEADQSHAFAWLRLSNAGHPDVQQRGADLKTLRSVRNWADYALERPLDQALAHGQVQLALDVVKLLDAVMASGDLMQKITGAIQVYERDVLHQVTSQP
jgi:hypothetical protein